MATLDRLLAAGMEVSLVKDDGAIPGFLLEEQAAALGLPLAAGPATRQPARASLLGPERAFVCACRPPLDPSLLGRFLDDALVADLRAQRIDPLAPGAGVATFVVDGPRFRRRVDATAGDVVPHGDGWRLELGLRGC